MRRSDQVDFSRVMKIIDQLSYSWEKRLKNYFSSECRRGAGTFRHQPFGRQKFLPISATIMSPKCLVKYVHIPLVPSMQERSEAERRAIWPCLNVATSVFNPFPSTWYQFQFPPISIPIPSNNLVNFNSNSQFQFQLSVSLIFESFSVDLLFVRKQTCSF